MDVIVHPLLILLRTRKIKQNEMTVASGVVADRPACGNFLEIAGIGNNNVEDLVRRVAFRPDLDKRRAVSGTNREATVEDEPIVWNIAVRSVGSILAIEPVHTVAARIAVFAVEPVLSIGPINAIATILAIDAVETVHPIVAWQTRFTILAVQTVQTVEAVHPVAARQTRFAVRPVSIRSISPVLPVGSIDPVTAVFPVDGWHERTRWQDRDAADQTSGDRWQIGYLLDVGNAATIPDLLRKNAHYGISTRTGISVRILWRERKITYCSSRSFA